MCKSKNIFTCFQILAIYLKHQCFFILKPKKLIKSFDSCSYSATKTNGHGGEHSKSPSQKQSAQVILHP